MAGCVGGSSNEYEFTCCVAVNSAFWVGGGIAGAFVGAAGIVSALTVFTSDMLYNMATAQLDLCSG
jgi:hypothetical protein